MVLTCEERQQKSSNQAHVNHNPAVVSHTVACLHLNPASEFLTFFNHADDIISPACQGSLQHKRMSVFFSAPAEHTHRGDLQLFMQSSSAGVSMCVRVCVREREQRQGEREESTGEKRNKMLPCPTPTSRRGLLLWRPSRGSFAWLTRFLMDLSLCRQSQTCLAVSERGC